MKVLLTELHESPQNFTIFADIIDGKLNVNRVAYIQNINMTLTKFQYIKKKNIIALLIYSVINPIRFYPIYLPFKT